MGEPRIRVSAILRWRGRILLCRHEKPGTEVWLLPGGGVRAGESLLRALQRELWEETRLAGADLPLEGPVAIVDSIGPAKAGTTTRKHVVHVIFAAQVPETSLEGVASEDEAVRGHRLFAPTELDGLRLHPPLQRFLRVWQPGDPAVYLGEMWAP